MPSAAAYLALTLIGDLQEHRVAYLCIHAALFLLYLAAAGHSRRHAPAPGAIVGAAVIFRLILLPATPSLSDDIYRYVWEGGIQLEGINPYAQPPGDPGLAVYRDHIYEGINYKELPAIYPPVMQWAFAIAVLMGRSLSVMKALFIAADVASIIVLSSLLRARGLPAARVLLYAWNPLVVVEVAGSGHNDPLAVLFLVASLLAITVGRQGLSMTMLALSALGKLYPAALLPFFARRVKPAHLLLPPLIAVACYLPYASAGQDLFYSARQYAERWRFNDSVFGVIEKVMELSGSTNPHGLARGVVLVLTVVWLAALLAAQWKGRIDLLRAVFLFTGMVLILQPTLHPWYLIWMIVWLPLHPSPAWIALSGLVPLSYLGEGGPIAWIEYLPFYALLLAGVLAGKRDPAPVIELTQSPRDPKESHDSATGG